MGTVFTVRHGRTRWTERGRVQGRAPVPLDSTGVEQLEATAGRLADRVSSPPARIVTSDLPRARDSAQVLSEGFDPSVPIETDRRWRKRNFGVYQGLGDDCYRERSAEDMEGDRMLFAPENGESWREVETRVLEAWDDLKAALTFDETVALVSHYGPIHCLLPTVTGKRLEDEFETGYSEAGLSETAVEEGAARLRERDV